MSNNFKTVLEERTENMKHERTRREQFSDTQLHASAAAAHGVLSLVCFSSTIPIKYSESGLLLVISEFNVQHHVHCQICSVQSSLS